MSSNTLEQLSTDQLEKELERRQKIRRDTLEKVSKDKAIQEYLVRPPCDILGRAYGFGSKTGDFSLAKLSVVGNAGRTYDFKATVCSTINTYLNNTFGWSSETELNNAVRIIVKSYLANRLNSPEVILELIGLSTTYFNLSKDPRAEASFEEAIIERMKEFSDKELLVLKYNHLSHGSKVLDFILKSRGLVKEKRNVAKKTK